MSHAADVEWQLLYDASDPVQRMLAGIVGLDRDNFNRDTWVKFMQLRLLVIDAQHAVGPDGLAHLSDPVPHARYKRRVMGDYLRSGRPWPSVEKVLAIPWHEQVRLITNGHPTLLWTWDIDRRVEFEWAVRSGEPIRELQREFGLPYHQTHTLVDLFRAA